MTKRSAQNGEDRRDSAPREQDSIFSSRERKRDACATATFERPDLVILLGLAVVTFGIYAQVIGHHFITLDDLSYIEDNPMVNRGVTLGGLAWAFTTFHAGNWHPLTWISHMIDSQLFGTFAGGHLLVNALIHTANTLLVFWFLLRTTHARWSSALVAALFALHPLHVESVAWASERKDTLSTFFGLLSLMAYVRYAKAPSIRRYAWVAIMLALGLMAKPMLVTWPFVMLLLDYWPLKRFAGESSTRRLTIHKVGAIDPNRPGGSGEPPLPQNQWCGGGWSVVRRLVVEKLPLFALVAASAVVTFLAQSHGGAVIAFTQAPVTLRLSNALVSYAKYLLLAFWPNDLAVYYPYSGPHILAWQIIGAALLLIGITAFCFSQRKTQPYLIVGWLWFLGTLVPVIRVVQIGGQTMADRYFYIPSIGLFIALVFGLANIAKSWRVAPLLGAGIALGVLLILATLTNAQIQRWRDSFTLFEHTLAVTPPNLLIEHNLAQAMGGSGRYDKAAVHFEKALQMDPNFYDGLVGLGVTREFQGRLPEAIQYLQAAIRSQPDTPKAHVQLGLALWKQNDYQAALEEMRRASQLAPEDEDIRADFGIALELADRLPEAIEQFHEALRMNPNDAETRNNLGLALLASGKARESIPEFETALRLKPELKGAADNLRRAQSQLGSQK
jgi:tetratricopeptide (TPR) repeat protein